MPVVIELKGFPGHDAGLVGEVARALKRYRGKAAIMSFDHWLIRDFKRHAAGIPAGLTAWVGTTRFDARRRVDVMVDREREADLDQDAAG